MYLTTEWSFQFFLLSRPTPLTQTQVAMHIKCSQLNKQTKTNATKDPVEFVWLRNKWPGRFRLWTVYGQPGQIIKKNNWTRENWNLKREREDSYKKNLLTQVRFVCWQVTDWLAWLNSNFNPDLLSPWLVCALIIIILGVTVCVCLVVCIVIIFHLTFISVTTFTSRPFIWLGIIS